MDLMAHPWLVAIVSKRHVPMMRELSFIIKSEDVNLAADLFFGLPMAGPARPTPYMMQRASSTTGSVQDLCGDNRVHNASILMKVGPD